MSKDRYLLQFEKSKIQKKLDLYQKGLYTYSFRGINHEIKSTKYYKELSIAQKSELIDNCNTLVGRILTANFHKYWNEIEKYRPIEISDKSLKRTLGKGKAGYIATVTTLTELGFLAINENYSYIDNNKVVRIKNGKKYSRVINENELQSFASCRKYYITEKAKTLEVSKVGVLSKAAKNRILDQKQKYLTTLLKDPEHYKRLRQLYKLVYNGERVVKKWISEEQKIYFDKSFQDLQEFKECTFLEFLYHPSFYYFPSKYGRVYHYFCSLPKEYYNQLETRTGKKLIEVDQPQAQPFYIAMDYVKKTGQTELIKDFIGKNWYKDLADYAIKNNMPDLGSLYYLKTEERDGRGEFKTMIIAGAFYGSGEHKKALQLLKSKYPYFGEWVENIKNTRGLKALPVNAQYNEAEIFRHEFPIQAEFFHVIKHDSVLVEQKNVDKARMILTQIIQNKYNFVEPEILKNVLERP